MNENQNKTQENGIDIDVIGMLRALWSKAWLITIAAVLGAVAGYLISTLGITKKYDSTKDVLILTTQMDEQITYTDTQLSLQVLNDYKALITCNEVLRLTKNALNERYGEDYVTGSLKGRIILSNPEGTRIIKVTVRDTDPERALRTVNELCEQSGAFVERYTHINSVLPLGENDIVPTAPSTPSVSRWTILGALFMALLVVIVLIVIFLLDNTIKSTEDVERYLGWATLASIPMNSEKSKSTKKAKKKE